VTSLCFSHLANYQLAADTAAVAASTEVVVLAILVAARGKFAQQQNFHYHFISSQSSPASHSSY